MRVPKPWPAAGVRRTRAGPPTQPEEDRLGGGLPAWRQDEAQRRPGRGEGLAAVATAAIQDAGLTSVPTLLDPTVPDDLDEAGFREVVLQESEA